MKRLFAALKIHADEPFLQMYRKLRKQLQFEFIKWVEENNIHITTKFFGETSEERIPAIRKVLEVRSGQTAPLFLQFSKVGIFGSSYAPKVVWLGIEPYGELVSLMQALHQDLKAIGYEPDRQNLVPHLTLGRIKEIHDKAHFQKTIEDFKTLSLSGHAIREMILYESILRREGPEYRILARFPFQQNP